MSLSDKISKWIKKQVEDANAKGVVIGISGGIDSACVAALSKNALGNNVLGLILPCESSPEDERLARLVADKFGIKLEKVSLDSIYKEFKSVLPPADKIQLANIKPRLRMITLYYFASKMNYLVAGSGNKSELAVGYFTKYGDGGVDILPLGDLLKADVKELAKELGVPQEIIDRPPTAGLWRNQTDESEMGITYENLDKAILTIESGKDKISFTEEIISKVKNMMKLSDHKRMSVPIYRKAKE
ncbi:MAG: NAD+ synthase [Candidatus Omnitrophica bacterium]|nr:NAD+ synthase [Candidatus Omnitrophota bacterium]